MSFKIYTRTGDKGETSLFGGARVPKYHIRIESYGTVDELNSWLGHVRDLISNEDDRNLILTIQDRLFTLGSHLAADPSKNMILPDISDADITLLEDEMDKADAYLPPLKNFILPGGHPASSACHVARCVCRRAERLVVALSTDEAVEEIIIRYLNRLSDYLFVLARKITHDHAAEEIVWRPKKTNS